MLESTGERLLPWDLQYPSAHYEHLQRYYFAAEFASGKRILDLGCGEGYGANILSQSAAEVIGIDINSEAVNWANRKYARSNLRFVCGSASSVPIEGREVFDVVVCFEMLEHVLEQESLIAEAKRLLKPSGLLIISTPNKAIYTDESDSHNPFHVRELYIDEFQRLIEAAFPFASYLGQRFHAMVPMWPIGKPAKSVNDVVIDNPGEQFLRVDNDKKIPMYVIAVASGQPFTPVVQELVSRYSVLTDISDTYVRHLQSVYSAQIAQGRINAEKQAARAEEAERRAEAAELNFAELNKHFRYLSDSQARLKGELQRIQSSRSWKLIGTVQRLLKHLDRQLARDIELIESSGVFSSEWYLEQYQDVQQSGFRAAAHYLKSGWREFRNPHKLFATRWYLERYHDVIPENTNPLVYFLRSGASRGHCPHPDLERFDFRESHRAPLINYCLNKTRRMPNLEYYDEKTPEVSIVILNFNKSYLTLQCMASIWQYTSGHRYEIIVVDNGSRSEDLDILRHVDGPFRLVEVGCNRFFSEGNNIGAEKAKGEYVLFLNNDVVAAEGWLEPLVKAFITYPDCGAAGSKLVFPSGVLQEAGAFIRPDGTAEQRGRGNNPDDPEYNCERTVDYVSAAALLLRTSIFREVGGFEFCWEPAYYEDVDLCFKIADLGLKTYFIPSSIIVHLGSATAADSSHGLQLGDIVEINRQKFVRRWHDRLSHQTDPDIRATPRVTGRQQTQTRPASASTKHVALFTPFNIIPGGGERVLLTIADSLLADHKVSLVTSHAYSWLRIKVVADNLGINVDGLNLICLSELSTPPDVWLAMGNHIIPPSPGRGKANIFLLQFPFPTADDRIRAEKSAWSTYDHIVVYSNFVKNRVFKLAEEFGLGSLPIDVIYPPTRISSTAEPQIRNPHSIIHVGRFFAGGHCKKQDLLIRVFERLVHQQPQANLQLHLVGSLHPEPAHREYYRMCRDLAEGLPIYFHLDASPAELTSLYERSSIYWHATGLGEDVTREPHKAEHFGISIVEAMSAGCIPVVYGVGGPTEIVEDNISGFVFNDAAELIELTSRVLADNDSMWVAAMRSAAKLRANRFSEQVFAAEWRGVIDRVEHVSSLNSHIKYA